jgi:hypothetical protein
MPVWPLTLADVHFSASGGSLVPLLAPGRYNIPLNHLNLLASDRDFDSNDYETLLALDENNPTHALRAASDREIEQLPVVSHRKKAGGSVPGAITSCCVCLESFEEGEPLRVLPCFHQFHVLCVDKWLAVKAECPVCKVSIRAGDVVSVVTVLCVCVYVCVVHVCVVH